MKQAKPILITNQRCNLCEKYRKGFNISVWYYSTSPDTELCKSCYMKWMRYKDRKLLEKKYKKAKPTTEAWKKKCKELQRVFDKWYYANGGADG